MSATADRPRVLTTFDQEPSLDIAPASVLATNRLVWLALCGGSAVSIYAWTKSCHVC